MSRFDIADDDTANEPQPELMLWRAALNLLIQDGMDFHKRGYACNSAKEYTGEQAFDDLTGKGVMLKYICGFTGDNPERIQQLFKRYIQKAPAARRESVC